MAIICTAFLLLLMSTPTWFDPTFGLSEVHQALCIKEHLSDGSGCIAAQLSKCINPYMVLLSFPRWRMHAGYAGRLGFMLCYACAASQLSRDPTQLGRVRSCTCSISLLVVAAMLTCV